MDKEEKSTESIVAKAFWNPLFGSERSQKDELLLAAYERNAIVRTCVTRIANAIAAVRYGIYKPSESGKTVSTKKINNRTRANIRKRFHIKSNVADMVEVPQHGFLDLLDNEEEDLNRTDFFNCTAKDMVVFGRAYWLLVRSRPGVETEQPYAIRSLPPYYVTPIRDAEGKVMSYTYTNVFADKQKQSEQVSIDKADIVDFRFPALANRYAGGDSPIEAALKQIETSDEFDDWMKSLLKNRARPDGIWKVKGKLGTDSADRLLRKIDSRFAGDGNGDAAITDEDIDYTSIQYSPTDLAPLQIGEKLKEKICNLTGLPPALLDADPKYKNLESSKEIARESCYLPILSVIESKINRHIMPLYDETSIFVFDNPLPEDEAFELEQQQAKAENWVNALINQAVSKDEFREEILGIPPMPDGLGEATVTTPKPPVDEGTGDDDNADDQEGDDGGKDAGESTPGGKAFNLADLLAVNDAVVSGRLPRSAGVALAAKALDVPEEVAKGLIGFRAEPPPVAAKSGKGQEIHKPSKGYEPNEDAVENAKAGVIAAAKKQEKDILKQIHNRKSLHVKSDDDDDGLPDEFIPLDDWDDDLAYRVQPVAEIEAKTAANGQIQALTRVGASTDVFSVVPAGVEKAIDKRALKFSASTNATTLLNLNDALKAVKQSIKEGILTGDPIPALTKRVQAVFQNLTQERAEVIARTETSWAVHAGQAIAAKASGIVTGFKYLISGDACRICLDNDGETIGLDDYDVSGDMGADGSLPFHPNCRCTMTSILDPKFTGGDDED